LLHPADIAPDLASALAVLQQIRKKTSSEHVQFLLQEKQNDFQEAFRLAAGLVFDVIVSDDSVVPGQEFNLTVSLTNGGPHSFANVHAVTDLPQGWNISPDGSTGSLQPGQRLDEKYKVKVPSAVDFTQPYWLQQQRRGDRFVWPNVPPGSLPSDAVLLPATVELEYQGTTIVMKKPAEFRRIDRTLGEQRSLLKLVPSLSVVVSPDIAVVPLKGTRQKDFMVTVENQSPTAVSGEVSLVLPAGWSASPASRTVNFTRQGEKASLQFTVSVPALAGDYRIEAVVKSGNQQFKTGYTTIAYPHIETRHIYAPAESKVEVLDVATTI
jgi:hypothetical protein